MALRERNARPRRQLTDGTTRTSRYGSPPLRKGTIGGDVSPIGAEITLSDWKHLYSRMRGLEAERLEAERRRIAARAAVAEQDAWAERSLTGFWEEVRKDVRRRAAEFCRETGCNIELGGRAKEIERPEALPALQVLELKLATSVVYLYTHHVSGSVPLVHLAHWPSSSLGHRHHHRMMSFPACTLERTDSGAWLLRRVLAPQETIRVDDLVFQAVELLVRGLERPFPKRLAPVAIAEDPPHLVIGHPGH